MSGLGGGVRVACIVAAAAIVCAAAPARAQEATRRADRDGRRLFQRFIEDAAIVPGGWVEGRAIYSNLNDGGDEETLGGLIAFRVTGGVEAGLRLGYLNLDRPAPPDGSGISDIDLYGKYRFQGGASPCALGGLLKAATADESKGLGTGKSDVEVFGACRGDFQAVTLTANVGARYNGDPDPPLPDANASVLLGGGILLPAGPRLTFVVEASWESERLEGTGPDGRLTLGIDGTGPGLGFRGAVAVPLTDHAPDYQLIFGAVYRY